MENSILFHDCTIGAGAEVLQRDHRQGSASSVLRRRVGFGDRRSREQAAAGLSRFRPHAYRQENGGSRGSPHRHELPRERNARPGAHSEADIDDGWRFFIGGDARL